MSANKIALGSLTALSFVHLFKKHQEELERSPLMGRYRFVLGTLVHSDSGLSSKKALYVSSNSPTTSTKHDTLFIWGENETRLAIPTYSSRPLRIPVLLNFLPQGREVKSLALTVEHAALLDSKGDVWQWGSGTGLREPKCTVIGAGVETIAVGQHQVLCVLRPHNAESTSFSSSSSKVLIVPAKAVQEGAEDGIPGLTLSESKTFDLKLDTEGTHVHSNDRGFLQTLWYMIINRTGHGNNSDSISNTVQQATYGSSFKAPAGAHFAHFEASRHMQSVQIAQIAAGREHALVLTTGGQVFSAALSNSGNRFSQLGNGAVNNPRQPSTKSVVSIKLNPDGTWTEDAKKEMFAKADRAWLGQGADLTPKAERSLFTDVLKSTPVKQVTFSLIDGPDETPIRGATRIACGWYHSLILLKSGHVLGFGSNEALQLGLGQWDTGKRWQARAVLIPGVQSCTQIACAAHTSYFVQETQEETRVLSAGHGLYGQLGNNQFPHLQGTLQVVQTISGAKYFNDELGKLVPRRLKYLTAGTDHVAAVMATSDGSYGDDLFMWGCNRVFQLGTGTHASQSTPMSPNPKLILQASEVSFKYNSASAVEGNEGYYYQKTQDVSKQQQQQSTAATQEMQLSKGENGMTKIAQLIDVSHEGQMLVQLREGAKIYCGHNSTIIY